MVVKKAAKELWQEYIDKTFLISGTLTLKEKLGDIIDNEHLWRWN